jgi:peptidoglycan/LPS O-acetylase OafA/YrhL
MRLAGLDGLRGLAALAVFGVHYHQIVDIDAKIGPFELYRFFVNGEHGVALFFILSGLLRSQPFWNAILYEASWPTAKGFVLRRLARILPAYYLCLTLLVLLTGYWRYEDTRTDILLHYVFLFNYAEYSIFSLNGALWTLAVEVQFYILLPLLFLTLRKLPPRSVIIALVLIGTAAFGLNYWLVTSVTKVVHWPGSSTLTWIRPHGAVLTHSLLAHLPHFIVGMIGGAILVHLKTTQPRLHDVGSYRFDILFWATLGLVSLLLTTELGDRVQVPYGRYGLPLVPLLLGAMVLSAPFSFTGKKLLDSSVVRFLGVVSYGFYLFHLPVMRLIDRLMLERGMDAQEQWVSFGLICFAVTLFTATVSYFSIERPVLRMVHHIS